jgi:hypothetical protein
MEWSVAYFRHKESQWHARATGNASNSQYSRAFGQAGGGVGGHPPDNLSAGEDNSRMLHTMSKGHQCYAYRQQNMWSKFAELATAKYAVAKDGNVWP